MVVADVPAEARYEARIDGTLAGWMDYRALRGRIAVIHTETLPAFAGRGVGGALATHVVADLRARGLLLTPICPFLVTWLERHPEHADLVTFGRPARQ